MLGKKLKELRKALKINQAEIAKHLGLAQDAVSKIENGKRDLTSYEIFRIAKAFDIPIGYFYGEIRLDVILGFSFRAAKELSQKDYEKIPILKNIANKFYDIDEVFKIEYQNIMRKYPILGINRKQIREIAHEERRILGFNDIEPITDIAELLRSFNIKIIEPILDFDINGIFMTLDKDRFLIIVNRDNPPSKRNFTLAHEYGHYLFNRGDSFSMISKNLECAVDLSLEEQLSNIFAAEFLMPEQSIRDIEISEESITLYMHKYKVSREALVNRLYSLDIIDYDLREYYMTKFKPLKALENLCNNLSFYSEELDWYRKSYKIRKEGKKRRHERKQLNINDLMTDKYKTAVIESYERGLITYDKLADYLYKDVEDLENIVKRKEITYEL